MRIDKAPAVCAAGIDDVDAVADVLVAAFIGGDLAAWLVADPTVRRRVYPQHFRLIAAHAVSHGQVDITADGEAVALWLPHDNGQLPRIPHYRQRIQDIFGGYTPRIQALDQAMDRRHPGDQPHDYLSHLAVHPARQRRGYGTLLLAHHHDMMPPDRPAYLEAITRRQTRFFIRHGYLNRLEYRISTGGPALLTMWRPAGG